MNNLPPKIKNLFWLREKGVRVPYFFILSEEAIGNIEQEIRKIISFFQEKEVGVVIIRSGAGCEDLNKKSRAGFFSSSKEILLKDLNSEKILRLWSINKKKAGQINCSRLYLFIQEFFQSKQSGVLFTQNFYNMDEAVLELSPLARAITDGKRPHKTIVYQKEGSQWLNDDFLSEDFRGKLQILISESEKKFPEGADIELGFKDKEMGIYQIRPMIRSKDQEILLSERRRLEDIFGEDFANQFWEKDSFVQTLGDLTPLSLSFYNYLMNSRQLNLLLKEAKIVDKRKSQDTYYRVLENIGGRTYFNLFQGKNNFPKNDNPWRNFKRRVLILAYEKIIQKKSSTCLNKNMPVENVFAWLFLSSIYLQFFLEQEKQKQPPQQFMEKLKNTEILCGAEEPRPKSLNDNGIEEFLNKYYYLSDYPYELASPRIYEQNRKEILKKYTFLKRIPEKQNVKYFLGTKTQFWLREKILWRDKFLKLISEIRKKLLSEYGDDIFNAANWQKIKKGGAPLFPKNASSQKLSNSYPIISGKNYPFPKREKEEEVIISPGNINFKDAVQISPSYHIADYLNRYIAVRTFPNYWIPFIPEMKGVILQAGSQFSHIAITCREYNIPCRIIPSFFND